jgi:hypothetical protein
MSWSGGQSRHVAKRKSSEADTLLSVRLRRKRRGFAGCYVVSGTAFGFSRFGGGYVDQKWRPHFGHTQN